MTLYLGLGQLPRSGALAPRGSGAGDADPHTDDVAESRRLGSTPVWRNAAPWMTWFVFLLVAYVVWRVAAK